MFVVIKTVHSILKLLNSETSPWQIAAGVAFGFIVGLTPLTSLHNLILFLLVCLLRVNFSAFFISMAVFKIVGWLLDPVWDSFGYWLLVDLKPARSFWIEMTTGPLLPFFRFNNTVVMGSLSVALILFVPLFIGAALGIRVYRYRYRDRIRDSKLVKVLQATPLWGMYQKYEAAKARFGL